MSPAPLERTWSRTYPNRAALDTDTPSDARPADLNKLAPEALEQFEHARQTAFDTLDAGVMGDGEVVVTISGHANPGHKPKNGQPNDSIAFSIQQVGS
jgi:hypothetical protein